MAKRVSLPPGVYKISCTTNDDTNLFLTDPGGEKRTLKVSKEEEEDEPNHKWLVSANGAIRSLDYGNKFTHLSPDKVKRPPIISSGFATEWISKVTQADDSEPTYTGTIKTNDGTKRFWKVKNLEGVDAELEVYLTTVPTEATQWTFKEEADEEDVKKVKEKLTEVTAQLADVTAQLERLRSHIRTN